MIYNLSNIRKQSFIDNPIVYRYSFSATKWKKFELMNDVIVQLPRNLITIEKGFKWDLSSVPSLFWWLLKPFGKFDFAYLVHDKLYQCKGKIGNETYTRKECDQIMRDYALAIVNTQRISLRRLDVCVRYYAVRIVGWYVWKKDKK